MAKKCELQMKATGKSKSSNEVSKPGGRAAADGGWMTRALGVMLLLTACGMGMEARQLPDSPQPSRNEAGNESVASGGEYSTRLQAGQNQDSQQGSQSPENSRSNAAKPANQAHQPKPAALPPGHKLTIEEAEAIGLKNNPQIMVGRLMALQAQQYVVEARSAELPQIGMNLTGVGADEGGRLAAGYLTNGRMFSRLAGGVTFSQLITDFGRTPNLVGNARFQAKAQDENAVATKQDVILAVDQAFYNTLETKALLQVAEETVKARQLFEDQIQALTTAKLKSEVDLAFAKVELARAQLLLLDAQDNYQASLSTLSAVLGYPDRQDFEPQEPVVPVTPPANDASTLIQQAMDLRPEIRSLRDSVLAAERFGRAEHDLFFPTVNALGVVGGSPVHDPNITDWYGAAGVNINIPIFTGFLFNARAKSADLATEAQKKRLQDMQDNVARDVRNSWLQSQDAYKRLSVTQQLREQAELALELAQARYKLGLGSIVEATQAELQKTDADIQDTDAHYRYVVSQIVLAYQMGLTR
ncbi:MAG TPA: TolC family protein [Candidatus Sulfotelmatobacter sp.]|nr:TolC family protein [Candidatus Sulfotelmatobacter sp.]